MQLFERHCHRFACILLFPVKSYTLKLKHFASVFPECFWEIVVRPPTKNDATAPFFVVVIDIIRKLHSRDRLRIVKLLTSVFNGLCVGFCNSHAIFTANDAPYESAILCKSDFAFS